MRIDRGCAAPSWSSPTESIRRAVERQKPFQRLPVYIFAVVPGIDNPTLESNLISATPSPLSGALADLAAWTGGHTFVASIPATRSAAAQQIVDELRQLYLIAFAASGRPGWHPLEVRARGKGLIVRARSGYHAGQSRPIS